ncbi:MAG: recombination protein RecR [Actinobacteria bacterium]|nr:recombination protein RecR [Actinomycetota bacterium]
MAGTYTLPVQTLIDQLGRLPGVGPKSAQRIAFHLLKLPEEDVRRLAEAINDAKARVQFCSRCFNFAEGELCPICADPKRDGSQICVVEESRDIIALERTGEFRGRYHVLLGEEISEVIVCTNPNTEGEVTAQYLARLLEPFGIRVTRPASGLPVGGDLEYADELTLGRALNGRRAMNE